MLAPVLAAECRCLAGAGASEGTSEGMHIRPFRIERVGPRRDESQVNYPELGLPIVKLQAAPSLGIRTDDRLERPCPSQRFPEHALPILQPARLSRLDP